jgi:hypothetical protein
MMDLRQVSHRRVQQASFHSPSGSIQFEEGASHARHRRSLDILGNIGESLDLGEDEDAETEA